MAQLLKNPPAMRETWVRSLGWEDPLWRREKLPPPVFWPGEFNGLYSPWGCRESDMTEQLSLSSGINSFIISLINRGINQGVTIIIFELHSYCFFLLISFSRLPSTK